MLLELVSNSILFKFSNIIALFYSAKLHFLCQWYAEHSARNKIPNKHSKELAALVNHS